MKWITTKVKLPVFTPLRVLVLLTLWCLVSWVGLSAVSIMLLLFLPKTTALVLLLIVIQLIGLFALALLAVELWVLWRGYTKTTKAHGLGTSITCGVGGCVTYEMLKRERMILNLLDLRLFEEN